MHRNLNVGAQLDIVEGLEPAEYDDTTANQVDGGDSIDRYDYGLPLSAKVALILGNNGGSPTSQSHTVKLQTRETSTGDWTDIEDSETDAATAADSIVSKDVNLLGAGRYIRAAAVFDFTGGTNPNVHAAVAIVLGGSHDQPRS